MKADYEQYIVVVKDESLNAAFVIECYTGLRHSELLGLKRSDIDWKNRTLEIQSTLIT